MEKTYLTLCPICGIYSIGDCCEKKEEEIEEKKEIVTSTPQPDFLTLLTGNP